MKVRSGHRRRFTRLELRRRVWDALGIDARRGTKRPGSNNRRKQA